MSIIRGLNLHVDILFAEKKKKKSEKGISIFCDVQLKFSITFKAFFY